MTALNVSAAPRPTLEPVSPGSALRGALEAALHYVNGKVAEKSERWAGSLDDREAAQGSAERAGYEGLKAELQGRNAIWAAIKGAWGGASVNAKTATVLLLVLLVVLVPVTTLLLILGVLIAALINAIKTAGR